MNDQDQRPSWKDLLWTPLYDAVERRWGRVGLYILAGLIGTLIFGVSVWQFWPSQPAGSPVDEHAFKPPQPTSSSLGKRAQPRDEDTARSDCLTPERSASEILSTVQHKRTRVREKVINDLYLGRQVCEPGWVGDVFVLPKNFIDDWFFVIKEVKSEVSVFVRTTQDASALRVGDRVAVTGEIDRVTRDKVWLRNVEIRLSRAD